jgi:hypothetical protein
MTGLNTPVVIPSSVTAIGTQAFYNCSSIPELTLSPNVKSYNEEFYGCSGLQKVYFAGTIEDWCGIAFTSSGSNPLSYAKNLYINNPLAELK